MLQANELIHLKQDFHAKAGSGFHAKWTDEATAASETLDDNSTFQYDAIGNLISDSGEGVTNITWTPYGKVRSVNHSDGTVVNYRYDATGNRVEKSVVKGTTTNSTRYIRDASGNVLAIYQNDSLTEQPIYGSSRLGMYAGETTPGERQLGHRRYELSNHLASPLAIITDNVNMNADSAWATIVSTQDLFPFGLVMKGRDWNSESYTYGFNGKMRDSSFGGTVYDYGFRIYKPSIAKFLSVDPLTSSYPWYTPYQFAGNKPIKYIDIDGLEEGNNYGDYRMSDALQQEAELHYEKFGQPAEEAVGGKFEDGSIYVEFTKKYYQFLGELAAFEVAGAAVGEVAGGLLRGTKLGRYLGLTDDVARAGNISSGKPAISKSTAQQIKSTPSINNANWAQKTFSETFSNEGKFAGQTIDDVANSLRSGNIVVSDVPIEVIVRDGNTLILNTRSSVALTRANVPRSQWNVVNRTGDAASEGRLSQQLGNNKLESTGTNEIKQSNTDVILKRNEP